MLQGAVIGCGNIALRGHLPAFRCDADLAARARIVAVVDMVAPGPEHADLLQGARFYPDLEACLRAEQLDFVDICAPPNTHAEAIRAGAAAGLHVLCEKPLADRNAATANIGRAVREAGIVFVPCHQYKYAPLWSAIERCVVGGELGRVTVARFEVLRTQADPGTAKWNPAWRTSKELGGGGILTDTGAHYFYLARWMFGMPRQVTAVLRTLKHAAYGVEDTAAVTLEYENCIVQLGLTWAANGRANSAYVAGTEGSLAYDGAHLVLTNEAGTREIPIGDVSDKSQYVAWYAALGREFVRRVEARDVKDDLLEEAEAVMRLLEVTYQAGTEHRTLDV